MRGTTPPLPEHALMAWCSVKKEQGQLYFTLPYLTLLYFTLLYFTFLQSRDRVWLCNCGFSGWFYVTHIQAL
jgi:hypothetical protein